VNINGSAAGADSVVQPVLVVWHDAFADTTSWVQPGEIDDEPCIVKSVGFLVPEAKKGHVTLAMSSNSHDFIDTLLHVPVGMVQHVTLLA